MTDDKNKSKVLIISHDKIGSSMAGPGIRYHYMAETLSNNFDVTVGFFDKSYLPEKGFSKAYITRHIDAVTFESGFQGFGTVISHWLSESMMNYCNLQNIFMVFDLYVPGPVENLAGSIYSGRSTKHEDDFEFSRSLGMYRKFLENGDLFLFSNQRQLDFWTGYMFGADQVKLSTYVQRPTYDRFIYAPMGIDTKTPLKKTKDVIKGVYPGIDKSDKVLLWTGGIWNHFDGSTLMLAMKRLEDKHSDIKLLFFGTQHPNPGIPEMKESLDTRQLAESLGLLNKTVFFKDGWVNYPDRINYLLEADVAVNTHKPSIETEFSHRTRVLDHFLAELPTISTEGDYLSDEVVLPNKLGLVVPANDVKALEGAILKILDPAEYRIVKSNLGTLRSEFDWEHSMKKLVDTLQSNPARLNRLQEAPSLKHSSRGLRIAKKAIPVPVKKAIIRTIRMK